MRIPRIYQDTELSPGRELALDAQASAHLTRVLRLPVDAPLVIFNGRGGEYAARLINIGKRAATVRLETWSERESESPLEVILAQGVSRGERMDYTIQKAVELGVTRIIPLNTERSMVNLKGERADKRLQHWQAVIQSACEQCGRNRLPALEATEDLSRWLPHSGAGLKLVLHHAASQTFADLSRPAGAVTLLIGPEGGLSEAERGAAQRAGFIPVRFGPRVLRTETAALAALAVLQVHWGDLRG